MPATTTAPSPAVSIFAYHRLVAIADLKVARTQEAAYQLLIELEFYHEGAVRLVEEATDVKPGGRTTALSEAEAAQLNVLFKAIRKAKEARYKIVQTTRLK